MGRLALLACLASICVASAAAQGVNPRGPRPMEPSTRGDKCAPQKEWPFCTSDEWGHKCPSGCRIQGLMDKYDHNLLKKIEKIRSLLEQNKAKQRSADQVSKQTYDYLRETLTIDSDKDDRYMDLAESLRRRITEMKIKIDRQMTILAALKDRVNDQVNEMRRLEVDIDIKLRSCKGSCKIYSDYQVDHDSYVVLDKQVNQLNSQVGQNIESVGTLYVMKKGQVQESLQRSRDPAGQAVGEQRNDVFNAVQTLPLILEEEGSPSAPATISKVEGTSLSSSSSTSSSSSWSSSTSSISSSSSSGSTKSITNLEGFGDSDFFGGKGGFENTGMSSTSHVTTKKVTCTKSIRRVVTQTNDGPVERMEEVIEGGPECQRMAAHNAQSQGDAKGSVSGGTKTGFTSPFGGDMADLGFFMTDFADVDLPDIRARSLPSSRVEREAGYIGKVCQRLKQRGQDGRQSLHRMPATGGRHCLAQSSAALCSDDDWVSKCPSGCRLQGLISQMETKAQRKLATLCETAGTYQDAAEKSMTAAAQIYNYNRRGLITRHMSELRFVENAEALAGNLTSLRKRSARLLGSLEELRRHVEEQSEELYRTEVDVDMKLRACRGSCSSASSYSVDHSSYQMLQTHMEQRGRATTPPGGVPHLKLQPVDVGPPPFAEYRRIPAIQREMLTLFEDIRQNHIVLEELVGDEDLGPAESQLRSV